MKYFARIAFLVYFMVLAVLFLRGPSFHNQTTFMEWQHSITNAKVLIRNNELLRNMSDVLVNNEVFCNGRFIGYKNLFAKLTNVVIDPQFGKGRKGGENLSDIMYQEEEEEYYSLKRGFFRLPCGEEITYSFGENSHLNMWLNATKSVADIDYTYDILPGWTIAVQRYEYVNLYHTMTDWFNTFLVIKMFEINLNEVTILWIDGHPSGGLDSTWNRLFRNIARIGYIQKPVLFSNMVWDIVGYASLLEQHKLEEVPYLEEFREFFLSKHQIPHKIQLNCDNLNILLIWRRDYIAHPRNPTGSVARKIKNEEQLLHKISSSFEGHNIKALQLDKLRMQEQLQIISKTDILIGMHGAGLSHTLFMPPHAGLVEMFPNHLQSTNRHFRCMATWRHLHYRLWENFDKAKELDDQSTIVDVDEIAKLAKQIQEAMCDKM